MKIGILGSGEVGRALGSGFAGIGDDVKIGSRDPQKPEVAEWVRKTGDRASSATFAETAAWCDLAVLATLWSGTESALRLADAAHLRGKVVIDLVNPLLFEPGKPPALAVGHTDSAGEQIQRWLPESHVVKAFNTVGHAHMVNPDFPGGPPDMFLCGDDKQAKATVGEICRKFGWGVVDVGGIQGARLLEPMCLVWIGETMRTGSPNHAFKLLRK